MEAAEGETKVRYCNGPLMQIAGPGAWVAGTRCKFRPISLSLVKIELADDGRPAPAALLDDCCGLLSPTWSPRPGPNGRKLAILERVHTSLGWHTWSCGHARKAAVSNAHEDAATGRWVLGRSSPCRVVPAQAASAWRIGRPSGAAVRS